ncbi:MAG: hypothetical protein IT386_08795 [Deltaproteobacteria bacterium]|nr:hypothetical protein [Deltaproteobacteria bacterium]
MILVLCATLASGPARALASLWDDSSFAARGAAAPERLFHYTTTDAAGAIAKEGLTPGQSGRVFLTPQGGLSPLQAHIDLALPPNRAANALLEVDVGAMRRLGIDIPAPTPVGRSYNMPGGGLEVPIDRAIPPELLRRVR